MRALDFDDLVCRPVQLLREEPSIREKWRKRIRHLLVDEFQDTSEVQLELVKLLANEQRNVCVVGDDDQSIYSWRGANPKNILEFEKHFPGVKIVKLETNYRSAAPILEVANTVIKNSDGRRHEKILRSARPGGDAVRRVSCDGPVAEAEFVVREIDDLRREGMLLDDVAVLYRSNKQSRPIEEELTTARIPFRLYGGQQFFDRKEVKDIAAYFRFVVNPYDEISLRRILNFPARGIGLKSVERIEQHANIRSMPFTKAAASYRSIEGLSDPAMRGLERFDRLIGEARERMKSAGALHAAGKALVEQLDLRAAFDDGIPGGGSAEQRYRNVSRLLEWLERFESNAPRDAKSLQDFLMRVTLQGDTQEEDAGGGVTLCTLHAAKGLEFRVVFLIGCIEGQIPHSRTTDPKAQDAGAVDLDEERRLFYVGITRARDRLYLTAPRKKMMRGQAVEVTPSRYMDELPDEHVQEYQRPEKQELSMDELGDAARELRELLQANREARESAR
jgi:DNA helicase-2/ATP-dependent DNA helicase PcrA